MENLNLKGNNEIIDEIKKFQETTMKQEVKKQLIKDLSSPDDSKMVQFLLKHSGGLIQTSRQAEVLLLVLVVLMLTLSFYFFFGFGNKKVEVRPEDVIRATNF